MTAVAEGRDAAMDIHAALSRALMSGGPGACGGGVAGALGIRGARRTGGSMQAAFDAIVDFVGAHRDWAPTLVFLLALGETIAFVSILIPSTAILVGVGALVAAGGARLRAAVGRRVARARWSGRRFSYWLGGRYGPAMLHVWPLNRDPELVQRGNVGVRALGRAAVLIGHFFGPLRAIVFAGRGVLGDAARWRSRSRTCRARSPGPT